MTTIPQRLELLRKQMKASGVHACIIPGSDPHASEYIAEHWKERVWISGFSGSAGTVVVTLTDAGLWTDSRYFIEGAECLKGTTINLMKMGLPETPDMVSWLRSQLKAGDKVAINPLMFQVNLYGSLKKDLGMSNILVENCDILKEVWTDRPELPTDTFFVLGTEYAGKSCAEKLSSLRDAMKKQFADVFIVTATDDIAWLFNIRGKDVPYNPVVIAFALVTNDEATFYVNPAKLIDDIKAYFEDQKVICKDYNDIYDDLKSLSPALRILVDGAKLNQSLYDALPAECMKINAMSPVFKLKSIKNEVELNGIRKAMISDGVALTKFFMWLEENIPAGKVSELNIAEKLIELRSQQELFYGESFGTIAGFADHGAINHYRVDEHSNYTVGPDNILLIDSGGQYFYGTTDITRTIATGVPTEQQKLDYTLVLKGHIGIATVRFPVNTRGSQIDILARKAMWDRAMNYGHGTGHGIGHFLNVHEGPQSIRMDENPTTLEPGMILSNEPGMYRDGQYGFRTENLIVVKEFAKTEFGTFYDFETLTLFPIETNLIDMSIMTEEEIAWLNDYHAMVYEKLSPQLNAEEAAWLKNKTKAI